MADYKVTDTELSGIANAIRTKGGTSEQLVFPNGFTSAINAIPTGGGGISFLEPLYTDVDVGYITSNKFVYAEGSGALSDIYEIDTSKRVYAGLGSVVGDRFRAMLSKFVNPVDYKQDVVGAALIERNSPPAYTSVSTLSTGYKYLMIQKTSQSQTNIKTFVFYLEDYLV